MKTDMWTAQACLRFDQGSLLPFSEGVTLHCVTYPHNGEQAPLRKAVASYRTPHPKSLSIFGGGIQIVFGNAIALEAVLLFRGLVRLRTKREPSADGFGRFAQNVR